MAVFQLQDSREIQEKLKKEYEKNYECWVYKCVCQVCGKVFYCRRPEGRNCSYRCENDIYIARRKERKLQERQKVCLVCGEQFQAKRKDTLYCSPKCKQKKYREALRL